MLVAVTSSGGVYNITHHKKEAGFQSADAGTIIEEL